MKVKNKKITLKFDMDALDLEFKDFLKQLSYEKFFEDNKLHTYSPLDEVGRFEQRGVQRVHEISRAEMLENSNGMKKLLANMLSQCKPDALTPEDVEHLSGINGRDLIEDLS